jgi:hypothetical protein
MVCKQETEKVRGRKKINKAKKKGKINEKVWNKNWQY